MLIFWYVHVLVVLFSVYVLMIPLDTCSPCFGTWSDPDSYDWNSWNAHGQVFKAPDQSPAFQGGLPKQGQLREDSTW